MTEIQQNLDGSQPLDAAMRERFCHEYIIDCNATQAAIRAGYSPRSAHPTGCRDLLQNPTVRARIAYLQRETVNGLEIDAKNVIRELAKLSFSNMDDYMRLQKDGSPVLDLSRTNRDQRAAIQELTVEEYTDGEGEDARPVKRVKAKLHDKRGPLTDLARHLGLFAADNEQARPIIIHDGRAEMPVGTQDQEGG